MSSNLRQNIKPDRRPNDYEYALISQHVYGKGGTLPETGNTFTTPYRTWIISIHFSPLGYFGAIYKCSETKQYVVAHRGTNSAIDFHEDIHGVYRNQNLTDQKISCYNVVNAVVQKIREVDKNYTLSFTGHSLGAFLAELSVWYATTELNYPEVSAVTFESPGSRESMLSTFAETPSPLTPLTLSRNPNPFNFSLTKLSSLVSSASSSSLASLSSTTSTGSFAAFKSIIKSLDIISYVCYPNVINVTNSHSGTLYAINVKIPGVLKTMPLFNLTCSHSMNGIVEWFYNSEIQKSSKCLRHYMSDWPRSYCQSLIFFKHAVYADGTLELKKDLLEYKQPPPRPPRGNLKMKRKSLEAEDVLASYNHTSPNVFDKWIQKKKKCFELRFKGNFKVEQTLKSMTSLPFHHFTKDLQTFLRYFIQKRKLLLENNNGDSLKTHLRETWKGFEMPGRISEELLELDLEINTLEVEEIHCKKLNVYEFREEFSSWLAKTGFTVEDLINDTTILEFTKK